MCEEKKMVRLTDEVADLGRKATIYVYPMGDNGRKVYTQLKFDYSCSRVIGVDNNLCQKENEIISLKECVDGFDGNDVLAVVSFNPEVLRSLRYHLENGFNREQVIYIYDEQEKLDFPRQFSDIRDRQMIFASQEIYKNGVAGSVAEAGVYRGVFAGKINRAFPDRKLYLFDTFEGFSLDKDDFINHEKDNSIQWGKFEGGMSDTSVDLVISKLCNPVNVEIRKGFVPETFEGIQDSFAFVNLDMDIYEPTKAALDWFWTRLSPGGYIFVHDYDRFDGITKAIDEFCKEQHIAYFRLGDMISVAIAKPLC